MKTINKFLRPVLNILTFCGLFLFHVNSLFADSSDLHSMPPASMYDSCAQGLTQNAGFCGSKADLKLAYIQRLNLILNRHGARISHGLVYGQISVAEQADIMAKEDALEAAIAESKKDGKFSAAEKANINKLRKEASDAIFFARHSLDDLQARQIGMKRRVDAGAKAGEITAAEKTALDAKLKAIDDAIVAANADGIITMVERINIAKLQQDLSKLIYSDRRDAEGNKKPTADRTLDSLDERQMILFSTLGRCLVEDQINKAKFDEIGADLKKNQQDELKAAEDGVLSVAEVNALHNSLNTIELKIKGVCTLTSSTSKPVQLGAPEVIKLDSAK